MLTLKQLKQFVKTRNKSCFTSNLQFQIDANACGFSVDDLPKPRKFTIDGFAGYQWDVPTELGRIRLVEFGQLHLNTDDSHEMWQLMEKAEFQEAA